jgi:hypothetical protein
MFGNRLGWSISIIILIFAGLLARLIDQTAQSSPATGWIQKTIKPISAIASVDQIIPGMDSNRDAGDLYRRAIAAYRDEPAPYDAIAAGKPPSLAAVTGLRAIVDAGSYGKMDLFQSRPEQIVQYERDDDPLRALGQVARAVVQVALRSDPATSGRFYSAVLSLGIKLYQERVVYDELAMGEELMGVACNGLKGLAHRAKDAAVEQRIEQFDTQRLSTNISEIQPVWAVMGSVDMNTISAYAGDWFELSQDKAVDPLWQVEGILKLGQLKYAAARLADQKTAHRVLTDLAKDTNQTPGIRAAAVVGRDLTIEQYRSIR